MARTTTKTRTQDIDTTTSDQLTEALDEAIKTRKAVAEADRKLRMSQHSKKIQKLNEQLEQAQADLEASQLFLDAQEATKEHHAALEELENAARDLSEDLPVAKPWEVVRDGFRVALGKEKESRKIKNLVGLAKWIKNSAGADALWSLLDIKLKDVDQYVPKAKQDQFIEKTAGGPETRSFRFESVE